MVHVECMSNGQGSIIMEKEEDCYTLDILSSLLILPGIKICFKITESENEKGIPIFCTKEIYLNVLNTIESNEEIPEQYPTWIETFDSKIAELEALEENMEQAETERNAVVQEAIGNIQDMTIEYNQNAVEKTNAFNTNATNKTNTFDTHVSNKEEEFDTDTDAIVISKKTELDSYEQTKESELDAHTDNLKNSLDDYESAKETELNSYTIEKKTELNTYTATKKTELDTYEDTKETELDSYEETKEAELNTYSTQLKNTFDENATEKTNTFNTNAQTKIDEFDEHAAELQEEINELSENMPWGETEQATEIDLNDAAKYSRNKMKLFGNTEQQTYTGKNLFNSKNEWIDRRIQNGIPTATTTTIDISENDTNKVTYSKIQGSLSTGVVSKEIDVQANTTYTFSFNLVVPQGSTIYGSVCFVENGEYTMLQSLGGKTESGRYSLTVTPTTDGKLVLVSYVGTEVVTDISIYDIQLEVGSVASDYEPYTNGPAPNPDYPQDIHTVNGSNVINIAGKNLFNGLWQGGYIIANGSIYANYKRGITFLNFVKIKPQLAYNISFKISNVSLVGSIFVGLYDKNFDIIERKNLSMTGFVGNEYSQSFINSNATYMLFSIYTGTNNPISADDVINFQLEEGATKTNFEPPYPYNSYPLELCTSKNRFNILKSKVDKTLNTYGTVSSSDYSDMSDYISVKANKTYILSFNYDTLLNANNRPVCYYDDTQSFLSGKNYTISTKKETITPVQDGYIRFAYDKNCYDIQIEEGSDATEYVPYSSMELCKIDEYQDTLIKNTPDSEYYDSTLVDGGWYKRNCINKIVLNENMNISTIPFGINSYKLNLDASIKAKAESNKIMIKSDKYTGTSYDSRVNEIRNSIYIVDTFGIHFRNTPYVSVEDFKENNIGTILYYVLNNPTCTQITDSTLVSQLEEIYSHLRLSKGLNHITVTASDLEPLMKLNYMQDIKRKLDIIESRISLLE